MELIKQDSKINFVGYMKIAVAASLAVIVAALAAIFIWPGPNWGIDFAGGAEVQVEFNQTIEMDKLRKAMQSLNLGEVKVQRVLGAENPDRDFLIRMAELAEELPAAPAAGDTVGEAASGSMTGGVSGKSVTKVEDKLGEVFGAGNFQILKTDYVGPKVGAKLRNAGILAIMISLFLLLVYISLRFEFRYALGAILALAHDVTITAGIFVMSGKDFNLAIIAALLTIVGYSLNDTIVVYDRIRENTRRMRKLSLRDMINTSINETLSRTILTAFTTLIVVFFLWLLGGSVIHDFAFTLLLGIIVGTYSSVYVASAFVIFWEEKFRESKRSPVAVEK